MTRAATVARDTLETQIEVSVDLDGTGKVEFAIGVPFLEHMLDQVARLRVLLEKAFKKSLYEKQNHAPQAGLLITFLMAARHAEKDLNRLPYRQLDYYFREFLRQKPLHPVPDELYACFELARE